MFTRLALSVAALGLLAAPAVHADEQPLSKGEIRLAEMIDGRVAGEGRSCINIAGSRPLTVIDNTALVYRSGGTVWVNRTRTPESIDDSDYLVIRRFGGSQLCRTDTIETYSRGGNFFSGVIFLDDFVPYRLADSTS